MRQQAGAGGAVAGAILAIAGALGIFAACVLPLESSGTGLFGTASVSIYHLATSGGWSGWIAVEPAGVALLSVVGAIVVLAGHSTARLIAGGALIAFGAQTIFLFLTYWQEYSGGYAFGGGQTGAGGIAGILAGLALGLGGLITVATAPRH